MHNVTPVIELNVLLKNLARASKLYYIAIALAQGNSISYDDYCATRSAHDDAQYALDKYLMRRLQDG